MWTRVSEFELLTAWYGGEREATCIAGFQGKEKGDRVFMGRVYGTFAVVRNVVEEKKAQRGNLCGRLRWGERGATWEYLRAPKTLFDTQSAYARGKSKQAV